MDRHLRLLNEMLIQVKFIISILFKIFNSCDINSENGLQL